MASREAKAAARVTAEQAEKKGQAAVDQVNARLPAKLRWGERIAWLTDPFSCENWMPDVNLKVWE